MKRKQILLNALTTFLQVIGSATTLFLLYRFVIRTIGVERLGIWSLVLATTSVITLANQGFSTGVVKFVAKYAARGQLAEVSTLIQTAMLSLGAALALLIAALYPALHWILRLVLPSAALTEAAAILPFAVGSLWLNILGSVLQAGLSGFELISRRNYVVLGGSAFYLVTCLALVPRHGLLGLAYAQAMQSLVCYLAAWFLLRRRLSLLPFFPRRWSRPRFREMLAYGLHFQFITASQALREPVTKALLARFGGLAFTGFYDIALRWVITFRELLVQSNQILVPTVSSLQETEPALIPAVYRDSYRLMFFLAVPTFAFVGIAGPIVSRIWLGRAEPIFIQFVAIIAAGWLVNALGNPAYVMDLGTGALRWVSMGCLVTAVLNFALGFAAGKFLGGAAVVPASMFSLVIGYAIVIASYHLTHAVPFADLLPHESRRLLVVSVLGAAAFAPIFLTTESSGLVPSRLILMLAVTTAALVVEAMWTHPLRKRLQNWVLS